MKSNWYYLSLAIAYCIPILLGGLPRAAWSQSLKEPIPPLPREIERALLYNSSQDFFHQGVTQFEQQIQRLREGKFDVSQEILHLGDDVKNGERFLDDEATFLELITPYQPLR
jgi:hypothetical protein